MFVRETGFGLPFGPFLESFWVPKSEKNDETNNWIFGETFLLIFLNFKAILGLIFESFFAWLNELRQKFEP